MARSKKLPEFRTDSTLGNLPQERQEQIAGWVAECSEGDRYQFAVDQLASDGIKVSRTAMYNWFQAWKMRQNIAAADSFATAVQDSLKALNLGLTQDQLEAAGQLVFTNQAVQANNAEEFREMEYLKIARKSAQTKAAMDKEKLKVSQAKLKQDAERLALEREKFATACCEHFLEWFGDAKAREIASAPISNAEKIAQLRQTYFADVDELAKTGKVVLPE